MNGFHTYNEMVCHDVGYREGWDDAVEKAVRWLYDNLYDYWSQKITDPTDFVKKFKADMDFSNLLQDDESLDDLYIKAVDGTNCNKAIKES